MNISIFASIGCQNLGDELILKNEIELLRQEFGTGTSVPVPMSFQVASYDSQHPAFKIADTEYFEYFPIESKNPKNISRNIKNFFKFLGVVIWSDIVVIGGGGIIYDSEVQSVGNPLRQWLFRVRVARFFRKKIYFYALGIDIKQEENLKILKNIFKKSYKITVRDIKSYEQLKQVGIQSELLDDPVMSENNERGEILKTLSSRNFSLGDFEGIDFQSKEVGLALRSGYIGKSLSSKIERLLISELCLYIEKKGGNVVFLPHSFHTSDIQANDYVFLSEFVREGREIKSSLREVYEWYNANQSPDSQESGLNDSKILISMRLHSIILASIYNIPQIVLSYSQKTDEVIKKLNTHN
ncbi:polysaccharide pyruvyl transferase family protein [Candidatus Gracilibacteria bacterium]|nr:polysaccharide pyruvyl transferase family protein [Candidatus Gracilibacteria bacterium]